MPSTDWRIDLRALDRLLRENKDKQASGHELIRNLREAVETWSAPQLRAAAAHREALSDVVELPPYPEYPSAVPGPLGDLLRARGWLHPALSGGTGLGALASVCPRAELHVLRNRNRVARPVLWIPIVAPPGSGKTPAYERAFQAIADYETDFEQRIIYSDITLEMLARVLDRNEGHVSLAADELAMLLGNIGNYSVNKSGRNKDLGRFLLLWSSQAWNYARVTDKVDIRVPNPVVSVVGTIQPGRMDLLGPVDNGMRARWLLHIADMPKLPRTNATTPKSWKAAIQALSDDIDVTREWRMNRASGNLWVEAQERWDTEQAGESEQVASALRKADEQALRVALVLAESCVPRPTTNNRVRRISGEIMKSAIEIVDYSLNCWRSAPGEQIFALSQTHARVNDVVEALRQWLEQQPTKRATQRDILRARVGGISKADDRDMVIQAYVERYGERTRIEDKSTSKGGRRTTWITAPKRAVTKARTNETSQGG